MIRSLETLRTSLGQQGCSKIAVAVAQDAEVLLAVDAAAKLGIATAILVGEVRIRLKFWVNGGKYRPSSVKNRRFLTPSPEGKVRACGAKESDKLKFEGR